MPQCPSCGNEVGEYYNFCPECGARLFVAPAPASEQVQQPSKRRLIGVVSVILIAMLLVSALVFLVAPSITSARSTVDSLVSCPTASTSTVVSAPTPNYDVQEVMVFSQSYTQLSFNVTAVPQCDSNGYGPSYLLNGLSNTGYWYQVGINWNWPLQSSGYSAGFGFVSEAWAPGGVTSSPKPVAFSGTVNPNDTIELSLAFNGGLVVASALDLNTGAQSSMSYPAGRASFFVGSQQQQSEPRFSFATQGYFTGLMTEWYHVSASYSGTEKTVNYTESSSPISSAILGVAEWNFTSGIQSSVFSAVANNGQPVSMSTQPQQFTLNGYTISADSNGFVT